MGVRPPGGGLLGFAASEAFNGCVNEELEAGDDGGVPFDELFGIGSFLPLISYAAPQAAPRAGKPSNQPPQTSQLSFLRAFFPTNAK